MGNRLTRLIWYVDPNEVDIERHKSLIIHHTLAFGTLEDIRYLFRLYSRHELKRVFLKGRKGLYDPRSLSFAQLLFGIRHLDHKKYLKKVYASSS